MSEASSYHRDYRSLHPEAQYYVDPRDHSSMSVRRSRYDSPRRVRDVSWISANQQPTQTHDPYARWYPPTESEFPIQSGQVPPLAHSSPMMRPTPSPAMPSPMIGEFMNVEDPEGEEEEVLEEDDYADDEDIDFDFASAPQKHTVGRKGARRWVGGFVQGLRKFPGLRKSSRRSPPSSDVVFSPSPQHENEPQFPTISSLNLRPLTPSLIAQTVEYMDMPNPQVHQSPSPQHHLHPHSYTRKPPPPAPSPPVYSGVDAVPQVLSTVDERSSEQTGTHETHTRPHSNDHTHSSHAHTRAHSHSSHAHSQSRSQSNSSQSTAHPVIPNNTNAHSHPHNHSPQPTAHPVIPNNNAQTAPSPWKPSTATVTDYVTVPPPPFPGER